MLFGGLWVFKTNQKAFFCGLDRGFRPSPPSSRLQELLKEWMVRSNSASRNCPMRLRTTERWGWGEVLNSEEEEESTSSTLETFDPTKMDQNHHDILESFSQKNMQLPVSSHSSLAKKILTFSASATSIWKTAAPLPQTVESAHARGAHPTCCRCTKWSGDLQPP